MTPLQIALEKRASAERAGKFWTGMVKFYDQSSAKWEETTGQRTVREAAWLEADEHVEACRSEWRRHNATVKSLSQQNTERAAA